METFPNYQLLEILQQDGHRVISRVLNLTDKKKYIAIYLTSKIPAAIEITYFRHELEVFPLLTFNEVPELVETIDEKGHFIMIFKDFVVNTFRATIYEEPSSIGKFLSISILLCTALKNIHGAGIIHNNLNPNNIFVDLENNEAKIIDFGLATDVRNNKKQGYKFFRTDESLAYISPEQTGKYIQPLDHRSDLYSFGIMLYEFATQKLPFISTDPLEIVHSHIAEIPESPFQIRPTFPEALSDIILKLLSKSVEDRYKTTSGLLKDLLYCQKKYQSKGIVDQFELGRYDYSTSLRIPQKLYGRKENLKSLEQQYEKSRKGEFAVILIFGEVGLGKTTLVNTFRNYVVSKRGIFIEGRFENNVNLPYKAIIQAVEDLFGQTLKVGSEKLNDIRNKIHEKIKANVGLVASMFPSSKYILGESDPPLDLPAKESENRLFLTVRSLIKVLVEELGHVVVFLDDLHYADQPSLKLINWLIENATTKNIFFIGSSRGQKGDQSSVLGNWVNELKGMEVVYREIELKGLPLNDFEEMMSDTFSVPVKNIKELSDVIYKKTGGNTFFVSEFLKKIIDKNLLVPEEEGMDFFWTWNLKKIESLTVTDNVVNLIIERVKKLPADSLLILQTASCIGIQFDLLTIGGLHPQTKKSQIALILKDAIKEEFIYPIDQNYIYVNQMDVGFNATYRFLHERVLNAFYTLIQEKARFKIHLNLGRYGLKDLGRHLGIEKTLEIANHFFLGSSQLTDKVEMKQVSEILLQAGKAIKNNPTYSIQMLKCALNLESENNQEIDLSLKIDIFFALAQAEYLKGEFLESENHYNFIENNTTDRDLKISAICQKMMLFLHIARYGDVIAEGKRGLALLKYSLQEEKPENIQSALTEILVKLGDRDIYFLVNEKEMDDPDTLKVINLLSVILPASYLSGQGILWTLLVLEISKLQLEKGIAGQGTIGLSSFGMIVGNILGDRKRGFDIGEVAIKISDKLNGNLTEAQLKFVSGTFLAPWIEEEPFIESRLNESIEAGIKNGDLPYIGYSFQVRLVMSLFFAKPIHKILEYINLNKPLIKSLGQPDSIMVMTILEEFILGENQELMVKEIVLGKHHDELIQYLKENKFYIPLGLYSNLRSTLSLIHGSYNTVITLSKVIDEIKDSFFSHLLIVSQRLNYFIALSRLCLEKKAEKSTEEIVLELEDLLKLTIDQNKGDNKFFRDTICLMDAMLIWVKNGKTLGFPALEKVIQVGLETKNFKNIALASEYLGEAYFAEGKTTLGKAYLVDAVGAWENYGCILKSKELKKKYSSIFFENNIFGGINSFSNTSLGLNDQIDYLSLLKSSQLLMEEKELGSLLRDFLKISSENAGAQRGIFYVKDNESWEIKSHVGTWIDLISLPPTAPTGLLNYVERTSEIICLSNAHEDERFSKEGDFITNNVLSVLCAPVHYNKKLKGIVYLENNVAKRAFGEESKEIMRLLCRQMGISIENAQLYQSLEEINKELEFKVRDRTKELSKLYSENERLLLNMLPSVIADRLKQGETYIADNYEDVSVIFVDMVNFTGKSESLSPKELVQEVHECFKNFDDISEKYKLEKIKTIGDAYLAVCGLPKKNSFHASQVVKAAKEMLSFMVKRKQNGGLFDIRIGINSGSVIAGVVGVKKFAYDIWGDTVNVAARMEQSSEPGKINISGSTYCLIKDEFECSYRGKVSAKNKGEIDMYFVV